MPRAIKKSGRSNTDYNTGDIVKQKNQRMKDIKNLAGETPPNEYDVMNETLESMGGEPASVRSLFED